MNKTLLKIHNLLIVPVVAIHDAKNAGRLANALLAGGLPCAEITFRTEAAVDAIKIIAKKEEMLVGAGTVLTIEQVKSAVDAGAQFIVSPGFNPKVVNYCRKNEIPITPGISNPTDIEMALDFDLRVVKFFPAEAFGGLKTLKAISAPYGMMQFIPTGGIHAGNLSDYLQFPPVFACGGSWMVKSNLISEGRFDKIEQLTREAVKIAKEAK